MLLAITQPTQFGAQSPSRPLSVMVFPANTEPFEPRSMVAPRAVLAEDVSLGNNVVGTLDEIPAHLRGVNLVAEELTAAAAVEVRAVRARSFQPAAAHLPILDKVKRDQPLVLARAPLSGFSWER